VKRAARRRERARGRERARARAPFGIALATAVACSAAACGGAARGPATASANAGANAAPAGRASPDEASLADGEQRIFDLGDFTLESGETIQDCKLGYRTFGKLDQAKSNAVLFPTWFTGTTKPLASSIPGSYLDTTKHFLILVDALGDGVSSSPSNSAKQPRLAFPKFTIHDMVESQKKLVASFGVARLHAVMGISMGGMQAFEWSVVEPDMVERAVSIVGTPQLTSQDLLLWNAELHALESDVAYAGGAYQGHPPLRALQDIHQMMLATPTLRATETSRDAFPKWLATIEADTSFDWNDWRRQLEAMLVHDVAKRDHGSLEQAARRVKAKMLVVVAAQDHMVNPAPAERFAKAAGAELVVLDGPCGHAAPDCELEKTLAAVKPFVD
jgi:homoserine O-acetyltransferase